MTTRSVCTQSQLRRQTGVSDTWLRWDDKTVNMLTQVRTKTVVGEGGGGGNGHIWPAAWCVDSSWQWGQPTGKVTKTFVQVACLRCLVSNLTPNPSRHLPLLLQHTRLLSFDSNSCPAQHRSPRVWIRASRTICVKLCLDLVGSYNRPQTQAMQEAWPRFTPNLTMLTAKKWEETRHIPVLSYYAVCLTSRGRSTHFCEREC